MQEIQKIQKAYQHFQEQQEQQEQYTYKLKNQDIIHRLYFDDNHVLGTEICQILGIHMANISNMKSPNILKYGNCPILLKSDYTLQPKIRKTMFHHKITPLKDKMSLTFFKSEYNLTDEEILKYIADKIEIIADRKFIVYKSEFLNKIKRPGYDNMLYILNSEEYKELKNNNIFKYSEKITSKKYLVIY